MSSRRRTMLTVILAGGAAAATGFGQAGSVTARDAAAQTATRGETVSLAEALRLAAQNEPAFRAAEAESRALALERTNARTALLPTAVYHNEALYTQSSTRSARIGQIIGAPTPVFIANNAIREYSSQGIFSETIGFQQIGAMRAADATAARAAAEAEIARRGLVSTVVALYYSIGLERAKAATAQRALDEANRFLRVTEQREAAREGSHADVLKAQLQQQQRSRELEDVLLAQGRAYLEMGVLLFGDPATPFDTEVAATATPLAERASVEAAAREHNPELRSAAADLALREADVYSARAAFLPELGVAVVYGIDAPQVAANGPDGVRNLGYSGAVTLDIPVWDWFATERRLKESHIRREAAKVALTAAQRRLLANLAEFYDEAEVAQRQAALLSGSVLTARESLRLTNLRYLDGEGTVLEVVDAQNTLSAAETAEADGVLRFQVARAQLQTLTGSF